MTSKWSDEFCKQYKTVGNVRKYTKGLLENGEELAFKEKYELERYKNLKKLILKKF